MAARTHGLSQHPLYIVWHCAVRRCTDPTDKKFARYGGRGITICDEWRNSYLSFYTWAIVSGWERGLEIDRKDNDLGYSPDNCRFITKKANSNNRSYHNKLTIFGETKNVSECGIDPRCAVDANTFKGRIFNGWHPAKALTKPARKTRRVYKKRSMV